MFASYLQFCGIGLRNAQLYQKSQLEVKRNQVLLDLARMIFEEQSTIEHMVLRILTHMQSLIQCQRVQVSLLQLFFKGVRHYYEIIIILRYSWYMKLQKAVFLVSLILKQMISATMIVMHELVHLNPDFPLMWELQDM